MTLICQEQRAIGPYGRRPKLPSSRTLEGASAALALPW